MMSRSIAAACAWLLLATAGAAVQQADAATLRSQSVVEQAVIRVGDLFDAAGAAEGAIVGPAPAPGERRVYELPELRDIAVRHGLDWTPAGRHVRAVIRRAGRPVGRSEIEDRLARAMEERGIASEVDVALFDQALSVHALPQGAAQPYRFEDIRYDERGQRVSADLVVPAGNGHTVRHRIAGRVTHVQEIPVLRRMMGRGEVVREADIVWRSVPVMRLRGNILTDADSIVGMAARRTLRPDAPLRTADLEQPVLVSRGSIVMLTLATRRMTLTLKGKAVEDGSLGQAIRVMNTRSNRIIEAVVEGPGRLRVPRIGFSAINGGAS